MTKYDTINYGVIMNNEMIECFKLLKCYKYRLNKQQYLTFKGQIKSKDYNGFRNGLFNLMIKKI